MGKSTLVEQFANNEYRPYTLIDFSIVDDEIKDLLRMQRGNLGRFFSYLSTYLAFVCMNANP